MFTSLLRQSGFIFWYLLFGIFSMWKFKVFFHLVYPNTSFFHSNLSHILISIGATCLVTFWILWIPKLAQIWTIGIVSFLISFLCLADSLYFRYFQDFITMPSVMQAWQLGSLGDSIISLISIKDLFYFVDLPVWIFLIFYKPMLPKADPWFSWGTGFMALIVGFCFVYLPMQKVKTNMVFTGNWSNVSINKLVGLLGFHGYEINRYVRNNWINKPKMTPEIEQNIAAWFKDHQTNLTFKSELFGKYQGKNVIIIQAEALQDFMLEKSVDGKEITPNLNALIKKSLYFSQFFHQAGLGRTSDADFSVQTSLHSASTGSSFVHYPNQTYDVLPRILKEHGYTADAYHAYIKSFWNRYQVYKNFGYDHFYNLDDFKQYEKLGMSIGDHSFLMQSADFMKENKQPFYSFMITLTSHHPFTLPQKNQVLKLDAIKGTYTEKYLHSVHYLDSAIGAFISKLKINKIWENTILIIYGDHDTGLYSDPAEREALKKVFPMNSDFSPVQIERLKNQVPLIVHLPDDYAQVYDYPVGQMDLAPSILDLLGIPSDSFHFMGTPFLKPDDRMVALHYGSFITNRHFYVASTDRQFENGRCFDQKTLKATPLSECKASDDRARKERQISDQLIIYNYLKYINSKTKAK